MVLKHLVRTVIFEILEKVTLNSLKQKFLLQKIENLFSNKILIQEQTDAFLAAHQPCILTKLE